jgi:prepilin-type N-terminal cleavage/methylation domain-containing protein
MRHPRAQRGLTLIELLLGLAMTAILMAPLAAMFQGAAQTNLATRAALDLNSDARFALDRIALRAATAYSVSDGTGVIVQTGAVPAPALKYAIVGTDLVESEYATSTSLLSAIASIVVAPSPTRTGIVASNAVAFKLTAPATGSQTLLRSDLTLAAPGGAGVSASRTVRAGSPS